MGDTPRAAADLAMDRYAEGNDRAFAELYDAIAPALHRHLRRHLKRAADADDLLQQTFLHLHRARGRFIRGARVLPWAFRIAHCLLIDDVRKRKRESFIWSRELPSQPEAASREACADELLHCDQLAGRIDGVIARLPEAQRVAFGLVRMDGLSLLEAAEFLETSPTAVKFRVFRAAESLRAELGTRDLGFPTQETA